MRVKSSVARTRATVSAHSGTLQGVLGAALVASGVCLKWGVGWAAIALGAFLLIGAWGSA